jgi:lipopolysaccharide transport system permease protein
MLIFGLLFNRVAGIRSGNVPYPLFTFAGLVPWTFFANAVGLSSNSLIGSEQMIRKIYFPRVLVPVAMIAALGLDMMISVAMMGGLMLFYHWPVSSALLWLPAFMFGSCLTSSGLGLFLSALNVQYRDVKYAVPFFTQMMFFVTPVLYPVSLVPAKLQILLSLNPMAGVVEGFRHALLGSAISWPLVAGSFAESLALFIAGLFFFRRMERTFADII